MTPAQIEAQLRSLLCTPQAPALVAWLERYNADWSQTMTSQKLAGDHGKLAHAAGSTYALQLLLASLRQVLEAKGRKAEPRPED